MDHRWFAILFGAAWAIIVVLAAVGNLLPSPDAGRVLFVLFLVLFLVQAACLMPLMLWVFVKLAIRMGNREIAQTVSASERVLVRIYWAVCGLGALVVVPLLLRSVFR